MFKTITSFTLAHSLTLAGETLGLVHVPAEPLSAMIALSILFLGVEVAQQWAQVIPAYVIGTLSAYWTIVYTAKFFIPS